MTYKNPSKRQEYHTKYSEKYREDLKQNAIDSLTSGEIIDQYKWDVWCKNIKRGARKHPYSVDFTNDLMFEIMSCGCFYCEQLATTIDRVDSTLGHTSDNCVASCYDCNISKGASDSGTFLRKAYFRARRRYFDDNTNIWFEYKNKPRWDMYKFSADKKGVPFDLTKEECDTLITGNCVYCHRSPIKWFGIDRVVPPRGYVIGNVASCCFDCNNDKGKSDTSDMLNRNERIANRIDIGKLVVSVCSQVILHNGIHPSSKKVCVHGIVYGSKIEASRALGMSDSYIYLCIRKGWYPDDIFEIN